MMLLVGSASLGGVMVVLEGASRREECVSVLEYLLIFGGIILNTVEDLCSLRFSAARKRGGYLEL